MRYAKIANYDVANGSGLRTTLFVQGCPHHCKGCFNPNTWDFDGGMEYTEETTREIIQLLNKPGIKGLSVLGGEPLAQGKELYDILKRIKTAMPDIDIWMWTGYIYEELDPVQKEIVSLVDVLVDGPFIEDKKDIRLKFRGSSNQRIIDIRKTKDVPVLLED
jgi:anaerobic ribonucleoside-triphosphate reductase activating protein